jgi:hypothetical protein
MVSHTDFDIGEWFTTIILMVLPFHYMPGAGHDFTFALQKHGTTWSNQLALFTQKARLMTKMYS